MSPMSSSGSTPLANRFIARLTMSTLPVRSPLPNKRAFDAVGAGHHAELGGRDAGAPVVVRMQADDHAIALAYGASEPLDDVAVDVGRVALHRRRQVEDQRHVGRWLDDVHDRVADSNRVLRLGQREALRRVLVADLAADQARLELAGQLGRRHRDFSDAFLVLAEHDLALQRVGAVVEVHNRPFGADQALVGALDQRLAALRQHLHRDVVRNQVFFDKLAHEVEVRLAGRWEADLNLLEAHLDQRVEHAPLALRVHGVDQRLVAVAQVDAAPQRRLEDALVGPGAVERTSGSHGLYFSKGILRGNTFSGGTSVLLGRWLLNDLCLALILALILPRLAKQCIRTSRPPPPGPRIRLMVWAAHATRTRLSELRYRTTRSAFALPVAPPGI